MLFTSLFAPANASARPAGQASASLELQLFSPVTATSGWILLDRQLNWTPDNGVTWLDITPAIPDVATIYAVKFLDATRGRVLWASSDASGNLSFQLSITTDGGMNWISVPVQELSSEDPDALIDSVTMGWLDENVGWVALKRQTGSNFSAGSLFRTTDAGKTWQRTALPIGAPVFFVDAEHGWIAGGPAGDQLYQTSDGGVNWQPAALPALPDGITFYHLYTPIFDKASSGLLPAILLNNGSFEVAIFSSSNGGNSWGQVTSIPLGDQVSLIPLTNLDAHDLATTIPNSTDLLRLIDGQPQTPVNQDGLSAGITELHMLTVDQGWGRWVSSSCDTADQPDANGQISTTCSTITRLVQTQDGGMTWQTVSLPGNTEFLMQQSTSTTTTPQIRSFATTPSNTRLVLGQGFDACTVPSLSQLQTWWTASPYEALNIYIGGIHRACANTALTTAYLDQLAVQGWSFIPTWVGPQVPCSNFIHRFSLDPTTAYNEGVNEANLAVDALAGLGLTFPDKSGSVVYYDLEIFTGTTACVTAAKSFINGWVAALHLKGHLAGIYGSTGCTYGLNNYLSIPNVPDVIWPAIWDHNPGDVDANYEPLATVWDAGCIAQTSWNNHQRIRQYEGAHNETWGGVIINIDNDVIDGVTSVPYYGTPSAVFSATPLSGNAPLTVTFSIANTIYMTSCVWNYGDGQTGTSCAATNTHTYNNPGTYTVSLTAYGPGGSNSTSHTNYIVVSSSSTAKPDLIPYPRGQHVNPLSLSSVPGTITDGTLYAGQPTYIDWGFKNQGASGTSNTFAVDLFIDDQRIIDYNFAGIAAGASGGYDDWMVTWNSSGWHTVKLVVDAGNTVDESNEANNIYTAQFYWEPSTPTGPTTISPSGTITATKPTYTWNPVINATTYELYVYSLTAAKNVFTNTSLMPGLICTASLCSYTPPTILPLGDYQFRVGVKYSNGTSGFSDWRTFTVGVAPSAPAVLTPTGGITDATPEFSWTISNGATSYDLYVYPFGSTTPVMTVTAIPASSACATGTCLWAPTTTLATGNYQYKVRAVNLAGTSDFSAWGTFSLDAGTPPQYYQYLPMIEDHGVVPE